MFTKFVRIDEEGILLGFIQDLSDAEVKELWVVLRDNEAAPKNDIMFKPPEQSPHEFLRSADNDSIWSHSGLAWQMDGQNK